MLSPQLRRQVFDLWSMFWAAGMTNPLTAIEQITYLLFLKQLESRDVERVKDGKRSIYGRRRNCTLPHHHDEKRNPDQSIPEDADPAEYENCPGHGTCHWSYIRQATTVPDEAGRSITPHDHLSQYVFPWLRALEETLNQTSNGSNGLREAGEYMEDAYFQLPREKTATLQKAIGSIDELFRYVGSRSADIMGDIFEFLLSEIQTSGKNGQFRTPRHIIRFMISLLDPKPGQRIVDPAAGTAGFLINSIQHLLKERTDPESLVLEWDGTPHRLYGGDPALESYLTGDYFTGYDNDRTMVRIGWMNMVLHGIDRPSIHLKDSLGKSLEEKESGSYDIALANPPFTGTVDQSDLHQKRFPRNPRNSKEPITNKTELLFVWLLLDLLRTGGRAAIIVPEGVLFGSTGAHRELRRQLLFEHQLEAVVSLPAGVFQPYTGVKTSILVFQKVGSPAGRGTPPRTEKVWFYEVSADGFSLDAKRDDRPESNDLWDALAKWPEKQADTTDYYQPEIFPARWRLVDDATVRLFPQLVTEKDRVWGIHELFRELPRDPNEAEAFIRARQERAVYDLYQEFLASQPLGRLPGMPARARQEIEKAVQPIHTQINGAMKDLLENGYEDHARKTLAPLLNPARKAAVDAIEQQLQVDSTFGARSIGDEDWQARVEAIVREFAKLDGYDVRLRSLGVTKRSQPASEVKSWSVPVRLVVEQPDWKTADGSIQGSHDENGTVRPEFLEDQTIYNTNTDWVIKSEYLSPDCIEANDLNLSASRYKPITIASEEYEPPAKIIRAVQALEVQIQQELATLLSMVEGEQ